jgi:hypothetical protein
MTPTPVSAAASFAIKTWLVLGIGLAIFLGLYVFEIDHRLIALNQAKAAIDCRSFKPGCYDDVDDEAMVSKIIETAKAADQTFDGLGLARADVRLGVADCLKRDKNKGLLVIWSWCRRPGELAYLKQFGAATGCKRLLILGVHSCGPISVEYDSAYTGKTESPSDR